MKRIVQIISFCSFAFAGQAQTMQKVIAYFPTNLPDAHKLLSVHNSSLFCCEESSFYNLTKF